MRRRGSLRKTILVASLFLLAILVYATGAAGNNHACAANSTHKVTDVTGTVAWAETETVDFNIYSQDNADVEAVNKDLIPSSVINKRLKVDTKPKRILAKTMPERDAKGKPQNTSTEDLEPIVVDGVITFRKRRQDAGKVGQPKPKDETPYAPEDGLDWLTISMISIGLFGGGAIIVIIKKLLFKRDVDGKPSGAAPQYPQYPQEPESFVYTDPATGAQTLYVRDPNTGEWYDPTTNAITDMSKLKEYTRQRAADRRWMDGQMDNLRNRNTATDRAWNQQDAAMNAEMQKKFDEIDRQGARDKAAIRSGTYGMSESQRIESQKKWQSLLEADQKAANRIADNWDRATKVAEGVQKAADIGMDIAATAAKAVDGGVVSGRIKDAYSMAKNMAGSTADAVARGKSVWAGIGKGFADGLVDIAQNNANGVYKTLSYVGGDAVKGGLNAAWEGENIAVGAFKGSLKGTMKLGIDKVGDKIRSGITKPEDSLRNAFDHAREIRTVYSKGISQKSVDALQKMNIDKHLANLEKADYQNWANDITNALSSNLLPDAIFGG